MSSKPSSRKGYARKLRWFLAGSLLVALLLLGFADLVFNLRSNVFYWLFHQTTKPLLVKSAQGAWRPISAFSTTELDHAFVKKAESHGMTWRTLAVKRQADHWYEHLLQFLFTSKIGVLEISPEQYEMKTSFLDQFALTTAKERIQTESANFAITANFRDPAGKPLGLVVHEGVSVNRSFPAWTGYFFVKAGKPWFGPKSLFEETPGVLQEASQGYPSLLKNHTVFSYVDLAPNKNFDGNKITYRALAGMRQNGTLVFLLSGNGGLMNVSEVATLAQKLNVQHATLLDGGKALQYSLRIPGYTHHFTAFNTWLDLDHKDLEPQRSPVFLIAKSMTK
ncbi:hypothetical protein BH11VER1_BH11VER1_33000 [soil metagenome]